MSGYSIERTHAPSGDPVTSVTTPDSLVEFQLLGGEWFPVLTVAGPGRRTSDVVLEAFDFITESS